VSALVRALERAISRRRRRLVMAGAALLLAAAGGALAARGLEPDVPATADSCAAVDDDLDGFWDETHRTALREAILATSAGTAAFHLGQAEGAVEAFAEELRPSLTPSRPTA
jgi:hypothetical protein